MIKSLSPYYVTTPFVSPASGDTCTSYLLEIYVWNGAKDDVLTPTYTITILNQEVSTGDSKVNISKLVNDFIDFSPNSGSGTDVVDGNNQLWVKTDVIYETGDIADIGIEQNITTNLMLSGYTYGIEGENAQPPANKVLIIGDEFNINRAGIFNVPILIDELTASQEVTVRSYPDSEQNYILALPNTKESSELVQNVWVDGSESPTDEYIEVIYNGVTVTLYLTDECRYTPLDIFFQNKEGAEQVITFFKAKKESMTVTDEVFESDRGQPSTGAHQFVRYNINAKSKFTINSGFVDESTNETFKQLFLSERVWIYDGTFTPVNISNKQLEFKTRANDRLINYEVSFEYAYNDINNV
jgi:hypothetical protein